MKVMCNLFILKWSYLHAKEVSVEYDTQLQIFNKLKEKTDLQLRTKEKSPNATGLCKHVRTDRV